MTESFALISHQINTEHTVFTKITSFLRSLRPKYCREVNNPTIFIHFLQIHTKKASKLKWTAEGRNKLFQPIIVVVRVLPRKQMFSPKFFFV